MWDELGPVLFAGAIALALVCGIIGNIMPYDLYELRALFQHISGYIVIAIGAVIWGFGLFVVLPKALIDGVKRVRANIRHLSKED